MTEDTDDEDARKRREAAEDEARLARREAAYNKAVQDDVNRNRRRASDYDPPKPPPTFWETFLTWVGVNVGWGKVLTGLVAVVVAAYLWYGSINKGVEFNAAGLERVSKEIVAAREDIATLRTDLSRIATNAAQIRTDTGTVNQRMLDLQSHQDKVGEFFSTTRDQLMQADNLTAQQLAHVIEHLSSIDARLQGLESRMPPWQFQGPQSGPRK